MSRTYDRLVSGVLTLAAVAIATSVVYRTFISPSPAAARGPRPPEFVSSWTTAESIGVALGKVSAPVTLVELTDLECPACAGFQPVLDSVLSEYPNDVRLIYVPHPLSYHRHALKAARGAECATAQDRLLPWIHMVYQSQDSLESGRWGSFAARAGIPDRSGFAACLADSTPIARVAQGLDFGKKIGLAGTPTLLLNGWMYHQVPTAAELRRAITAVIGGRKPFPAR